MNQEGEMGGSLALPGPGTALIRERPILFSGPMLRALLEGRKTVTRRIAKKYVLEGETGIGGGYVPAECPYGIPGDRLWVRESFNMQGTKGGFQYAVFRDGAQKSNDGMYSPGLKEYNAGAFNHIKWKPSIHMPRWASRLTLEITDTRIENLKDITEEQAIAEGIERINDLPVNPLDFTACWKDYTASQPYWNSPIDSFHSLWEKINGTGAWELNPMVYAVSFRRIENERSEIGVGASPKPSNPIPPSPTPTDPKEMT